MKTEREVTNGGVEEERAVKRKRVVERSNDHDVDEAENEQKKDNGVAKVEKKVELDDEEDDDADASKLRGKHSRRVEVRRDCPYLDTVNRQVMYLSNHMLLFFGISIFNTFLDIEFHSGLGF